MLHFVGSGVKPNWTMDPSLDAAAPNVLVNEISGSSETNPILEIDLDGTPPTNQGPVGTLTGYNVDSAY